MGASGEAPYEGRFGADPNLRLLAGRGAIVNSVFQVALAVVTLVRGVAVAALVSAADYGTWGLLALALWTALALRYLGVNEKYVQQADDDQELAYQRAFTIELIFAAAGSVVLIVFAWAFAAITGHSELVVPALVLVLMLPAGALQFPIWAYHRRMDFRTQRKLQVVEPLTATAVTIGLAAAGAGYWSFVGGAVAGAWLGAIAALTRSVHPLALRFSRATLREYVGFSGPLLVAGVAVLAVFQVIYLVGNESLGLAGLGAFTLAGNVLAFTDRADAVITEALYPALCAVRDRTAVLREAFVKSNRLALMWAVPFGLGVTFFASDLVRFALGDEWRPAIGLLEMMGVVTAVHHVGFNWHAFYRARGQTRPIAVSGVLAAVAFIAAAIPLMQERGLTGLAWAFLISEAVGFATRAVYLRRLFDGFVLGRHLVRAFLPTMGAAGAVLLLRALESGGRPAGVALAEFAAYVLVTIALTLAFERPLLREAYGYAFTRVRHA